MELTLTTLEETRAALRKRFGILHDEKGYNRATLARICRNAAGLLCPINKRSLLRAVLEPLETIGYIDLSDYLIEVIDTLVSQGDLLELEEMVIDNSQHTHEVLLYAAPPQFIPISSTKILLLGVAPDDALVIPEEIEQQIEYVDCMRLISSQNTESIITELEELDLYKVPAETWLRAPQVERADVYIEKFHRLLNQAGRSGAIPGLIILDPDKSSNYYKGRWRELNDKDTGQFIGKRSRAFGGVIWCYVDVDRGITVKLVDLPHGQTEERGCDQAWRLQAAIDQINNHSQRLRTRQVQGGKVTLDIFSPIPKWLERRWGSIGTRVRQVGCLASYCFESKDIDAEITFASEFMWLKLSIEQK